MSRSISRLKAAYYKNKKRETELLEGYESFLNDQEHKCLIGTISTDEQESNVLDYQDQLFYYQFACWQYEIRDALRDFIKNRKKFTGFDKAGIIIDEINWTSPRKKKVSYKTSEFLSKAKRKIAELAYNILVTKAKMVPIHLSEKRKFPLPLDEQPAEPEV